MVYRIYIDYIHVQHCMLKHMCFSTINPHAVDKPFECQKFNASIMWQLHEGMFFLFRKRLCWCLSDTYVMFMNSDRYFFLPFSMFFCAEVDPVRRQKSRHVMPCFVGITNDVNVNPMSKNDEVRLLGLNLGLSRDVNLWTNGRIGCKRFLMDQSRRVVSWKTRRLQ